MSDSDPNVTRPAALMIAARTANIAAALVTIPVLIRYLGGNGFAAWAVLLALGAGFSTMEIGMAPTVMRFLALPSAVGQWDDCRRVFGRMWCLLACSFAAGSLLVVGFARPFAAWMGLPGTATLTAEQAIYAVFAATCVRALLQSGYLAMLAARRYGAAATVSLLQSLCSNAAAALVAWQSGRLDLTLAAFWAAQLAVLSVVFVSQRRACFPRFDAEVLRRFGRLREMGYFGLANQLEGWAQFVNFQYDKFIVAGLVGLWGVAPYEVANRAVAALRSVPASGAESFLPAAVVRHADPEDAWRWYMASTKLAAYGVLVFMLAPLAVAPLFLYAWTGQMGHIGRWPFVALSVGAMAGVLALPAATLMQAANRPGVPGRAALLSIVVNIPLSLLLVTRWELVGAAIGTAVAMSVGALQLGLAAHRHFSRPVAPTLRVLRDFWPPALVCVCGGVLAFGLFDAWFATVEPAMRFARTTRVYPAVAAGCAYATIVCIALALELARGRLRLELAPLARRLGIRWWR